MQSAPNSALVMVDILSSLHATVATMKQFKAPEALGEDDRVTSVQLAREIIEALRHMKWDRDERKLENEPIDNAAQKARKLLEVALAFNASLALIKEAEDDLGEQHKSELQNNKIIQRSFEAFEQLGFRMKEQTHARLQKEGHTKAAQNIKQEMDEAPRSLHSSASSEELFSQVDAGLKEAARIQQQARIAARMAQRQAQREANRLARQSQQASRIANAAMQSMKSSTFSKANLRGASNPTVARTVREAQDRAQKEADAQLAALPNDTTPRGR